MEGSVDVVQVLKVFGRYRFETLSRLLVEKSFILPPLRIHGSCHRLQKNCGTNRI